MSPALSKAQTVLVSACLLGARCRYDGADCRSEKVAQALADKEVVPLCPEAGAGLGVPRPPVELEGGDGTRVLEGRARARVKATGEECSARLLDGARLATAAAARFGATAAVLKDKSPSCGVHRVWVGGKLESGSGVAAAALGAAGLTLVSDEEL